MVDRADTDSWAVEPPFELFKSTENMLDVTQDLSSDNESDSSEIISDLDDTFNITSSEVNLSLPDSFDGSTRGGGGGDMKGGKVTASITTYVDDVLKNLIVSERKLSELRTLNRDNLTVQEAITLRFNEMMVPLQKDLNEARNALDITRNELNLSVFNINSQTAEISRLRSASTSEIERFKSEYEEIRVRNVALGRQLDDEIKLRRMNEDKVSKYDAVYNEANFYKKEMETLRKGLNEQVNVMKSLQSDDKQMTRRLADTEREREIFRTDKAYLSKELESAQATIETLKIEKDSISAKCINLESRVTELMEQLLNAKSQAEATFDERNRRELDSIRNLIMKESEASKLTAEQTYEREAISMKETIITLQTENKRYKEEITTLQAQNGKSGIEYNSAIQAKDHELNELRASLKMKTFELTSLGIVFEERMEQLRRKETENNRHMEQLNILKAALHKMELEGRGRDFNALMIDEDDENNVIVEGGDLSLSFNPQRVMNTSSNEYSYVKDDINELNAQVEKLNAARSELEELQSIIRNDYHNNTGSNNGVSSESESMRGDTVREGEDNGNDDKQHELQVHPENGLLVMG